MVENAFGTLKHTFRELLNKSDLHVVFLPDVIVACAILHNMLLGQSHEEVENLLQILKTKGLDGTQLDGPKVDGGAVYKDGGEGVPDMPTEEIGMEKRDALEVWLTMQRQI